MRWHPGGHRGKGVADEKGEHKPLAEKKSASAFIRLNFDYRASLICKAGAPSIGGSLELLFVP